MSGPTCDYVASKDDPESWHGTHSSEFYLNISPERGGLGITEWHCPHPPIEGDGGDGEQYCVFHADPSAVPEDVDETAALLAALDEAGEGPRADRPEHRGQFVGATFGAVDLSDETLVATDDHDVRFDHARFRADDALEFEDTTFATEGHNPVSFIGTTFRTTGEGSMSFAGATFRAAGAGSVWFEDATFGTAGDGSVWFEDATFETAGEGSVWFGDATFRTAGDGSVWFGDATFETAGEGSVVFNGAAFRTVGDGSVMFNDARFGADGDGSVLFYDTTFETEGDGAVSFEDATFGADGDGAVSFEDATFGTAGSGSVWFGGATLTDATFRHADLGEANVSGADITGTDLGEAAVDGVSVNGSTTCERLYEGYDVDHRVVGVDTFVSVRLERTSAALTRLRLLVGRSAFDAQEWDSTARAYNDLKTVFSDHGLVGKARDMHVRERRARSLEAKAENGWLDRRYLGSLPSRIVTGYGVRVGNLLVWMLALFLVSTVVYLSAGVGVVEGGLVETLSYSVLAFTVAPPTIPSRLVTQVVMMVETFFGTLFIVLLGYILGNRDRF